jgi:hypothetical protein
VSLYACAGGKELSGRTGSTTVFPHGDARLRPVELGASIFVEANRHLVRAAEVHPVTHACPHAPLTRPARSAST